MSHLLNEIQEQPQVMDRLLSDIQPIQQAAQAIRQFNPKFVVIAARGTSDNAARYAQYLLSIRADLPVALATPSVHTLYQSAPIMREALVIGISQSGQSRDIRQVLEDARHQAALTISITNDTQSPLAQIADYHIPLLAGHEKSVAATKTYTAELMALALLVDTLVQDTPSPELRYVGNWIHNILQQADTIGNWAQRYRYMERLAVIGRGYNYCTAFEISLKIKELCYIVSEEYSEADFRHGPIAIISQGFPVIAIAPAGKPYPQMLDLVQKLNEKQAECLVISNQEDILNLGVNTMPLPADVPEWLSPLCSIIPGQLFAYHLAGIKGYDIDQPRNLQKVTITE